MTNWTVLNECAARQAESPAIEPGSFFRKQQIMLLIKKATLSLLRSE